MLKLTGDGTGIPDRVSDPVGIERRPATVTRDLTLDELPERDADRRRAQREPVRSPRLVAHLDARHPVADDPRSVAVLTSLLHLPTAATHVCNVYDAPDGETVCGAARSAAKQECMSALRD
jgi:hypothetical protein